MLKMYQGHRDVTPVSVRRMLIYSFQFFARFSLLQTATCIEINMTSPQNLFSEVQAQDTSAYAKFSHEFQRKDA
jgi:hypothetical protein